MLVLLQNEIAQRQTIQAVIVETPDRLTRMSNDRFAHDIERCVQQQRFVTELSEFIDQIPKSRVELLLYRLRAQGRIRMDYCRHFLALALHAGE